MQVPGSDNAGPGRDILGLELESEGIETLLEKKKANGIMFGSKSIFSEIFISEWTLSLSSLDYLTYHEYPVNTSTPHKFCLTTSPGSFGSSKYCRYCSI